MPIWHLSPQELSEDLLNDVGGHVPFDSIGIDISSAEILTGSLYNGILQWRMPAAPPTLLAL